MLPILRTVVSGGATSPGVLAARFLACLARRTLDVRYATAVRRGLASLATPERIRARGKFIGDFLSALEETKAIG